MAPTHLGSDPSDPPASAGSADRQESCKVDFQEKARTFRAVPRSPPLPLPVLRGRPEIPKAGRADPKVFGAARHPLAESNTGVSSSGSDLMGLETSGLSKQPAGARSLAPPPDGSSIFVVAHGQNVLQHVSLSGWADAYTYL